MIPMIGTIKSAVKLAELDSKWQQKKENAGKCFQQKELSFEEQQIEAFKEDMEKMRENDSYASIYTKLKSGKKLTHKEAEYLQKKDPQAYADYKIAEAEKEGFKKKLKNCKTKEEVRKLKTLQMGNFLSQAKTISNNPNIPKGKKMELLGKIMGRVLGLNEVYTEFVKSSDYTNLKDVELINNEEENQEKPKKDKKKPNLFESEETVDTLLGEEFAEIEIMFQKTQTSDFGQTKTENVDNDATQDVKCDS